MLACFSQSWWRLKESRALALKDLLLRHASRGMPLIRSMMLGLLVIDYVFSKVAVRNQPSDEDLQRLEVDAPYQSLHLERVFSEVIVMILLAWHMSLRNLVGKVSAWSLSLLLEHLFFACQRPRCSILEVRNCSEGMSRSLLVFFIIV